MRATRSRMQELPKTERPRERLLSHGGRSLADFELVAVLLRTGSRGTSALALAQALVGEHGGLAGLLVAHPTSLRRAGLGEAKAATVLAALEIGRRLARLELPERDPMTTPKAVARYLYLRFGVLDQEIFGALFLDVKNKVVGERELFRGTLDRSLVEPRAILKAALLAGAAGMVLFHTHPSGDINPSVEDLLFTRRVQDAGDLVGVRLIDHLILGGCDRWVSLREREGW